MFLELAVVLVIVGLVSTKVIYNKIKIRKLESILIPPIEVVVVQGVFLWRYEYNKARNKLVLKWTNEDKIYEMTIKKRYSQISSNNLRKLMESMEEDFIRHMMDITQRLSMDEM